ncbi:spermidine synthase [Marinicella rhabdoformis]|uniref:spermine/spermidine synthase domain-containing protein n=1 Tax=Marinicella rhabdoformis TaxID=2580566 RepID=UPI0012AEDCE2|nr:spermidine synthase [Marinicella rhabdoformis]
MQNFPLSHRFLVFGAFIVSGVAGLVYESVWSQYLGLFLGHAAFAQTLTLAIFMGGMALGAWIVSKNINKFKNAVLAYAVIELILGLLGLVFHNVFDFTIHYSFDVIFPSLGSPALITILKWLIASFLILPQSILLGATFPLLSSGIIRRAGRSEGGIISMLYFSNSLGAAFGAILATFVLIPAVGMPGALLVAGILNLFVALAIYIVAKAKEPSFNRSNIDIKSKFDANSISKTLIVSVALFTGFASFVYEISWIRMLNLVLGTTLHSFEIMLSAFILGLALGGLWIKKRIDHIQDIVKYLGVIQILMGTLALLTMPMYIESFSWVAEILKHVLKSTDTGYTFYNILTAVLAMLIMMPAAFFAGMTLPLLTMILMKKGENETAIGKVYAFNTVGALLGVWFAIHLGMIYLGLKYMLVFASLVDFVLGLLLIMKARNEGKFRLANVSPAVYLVALILVIVVADFSPRTLASGTYRYARDTISDKSEVLFYEDGKSASISVTKEVKNNLATLVIATNGKPDAGIIVGSDTAYSVDEPTMVLAGAIPLLIKPNVKNVANIGFGSGLTTNTLLASESLETLDTIEIEPNMIEGAKLFGEKNERVFKDERSNLVIDDAKTYFASNNKKYDIIVSEPSNPWVMGVGNLFTENFYSHIKNYLNEDGVLVQWLQLYEISPTVLASAFNAITQEFNYFDLYRANSGDVIMVVSDSQIPKFKYGQFEQLPSLLKSDLERIGISHLSHITTRKAGNSEILGNVFRFLSKAVNSDYFPILSLQAPKDRYKNVSSIHLFEYTKFGLPVFEILGTQADYSTESFSGYDKNHPYLKLMSSRMNLLEYLVSNENKDLTTIESGYVHIFSQSDYYCGQNDVAKEQKWTGNLIDILNHVAILGTDQVSKIFENTQVINCLDLINNKELKSTVELLNLFYKKDYYSFIQLSNEILKVDVDLHINIKKELFNYGLFSIIMLQSSNGELPLTADLYLRDRGMFWQQHSAWLLAQLEGI